MWLRSDRRQRVRVGALDLTVEFAAGEEMLTEVSCKFRPDGVERRIGRRGTASHPGGGRTTPATSGCRWRSSERAAGRPMAGGPPAVRRSAPGQRRMLAPEFCRDRRGRPARCARGRGRRIRRGRGRRARARRRTRRGRRAVRACPTPRWCSPPARSTRWTCCSAAGRPSGRTLACLPGEYGPNLAVMSAHGFTVRTLPTRDDGRLALDDAAYQLDEDPPDLVHLTPVASHSGVRATAGDDGATLPRVGVAVGGRRRPGAGSGGLCGGCRRRRIRRRASGSPARAVWACWPCKPDLMERLTPEAAGAGVGGQSLTVAQQLELRRSQYCCASGVFGGIGRALGVRARGCARTSGRAGRHQPDRAGRRARAGRWSKRSRSRARSPRWRRSTVPTRWRCGNGCSPSGGS